MSIKYRSVKFILNYRDEKPQVWKAQKLTFPVITEDALIEYIANSAAIPKSTVKACALSIAEAIIYFCTNGHAVQVPGIGTFGLQFKTKTAKTEEDVTEENINRKYIRFWAKHDIRNLCNMDNINVEVKDILKLKED